MSKKLDIEKRIAINVKNVVMKQMIELSHTREIIFDGDDFCGFMVSNGTHTFGKFMGFCACCDDFTYRYELWQEEEIVASINFDNDNKYVGSIIEDKDELLKIIIAYKGE